MQLLGITYDVSSAEDFIKNFKKEFEEPFRVVQDIEKKITARTEAKKARDFKEADRIRDELKAQGIILEDKPDGTTEWRRA